MTDRRRIAPRVFVPFFIGFMGLIAFSNATSNHRLDAVRSVDIVRLLAAGVCFGVAIAALGMFFVGRRSR